MMDKILAIYLIVVRPEMPGGIHFFYSLSFENRVKPRIFLHGTATFSKYNQSHRRGQEAPGKIFRKRAGTQ
jgi:hypothetical protein